MFVVRTHALCTALCITPDLRARSAYSIVPTCRSLQASLSTSKSEARLQIKLVRSVHRIPSFASLLSQLSLIWTRCSSLGRRLMLRASVGWLLLPLHSRSSENPPLFVCIVLTRISFTDAWEFSIRLAPWGCRKKYPFTGKQPRLFSGFRTRHSLPILPMRFRHWRSMKRELIL
jgi:hypothetical protein